MPPGSPHVRPPEGAVWPGLARREGADHEWRGGKGCWAQYQLSITHTHSRLSSDHKGRTVGSSPSSVAARLGIPTSSSACPLDCPWSRGLRGVSPPDLWASPTHLLGLAALGKGSECEGSQGWDPDRHGSDSRSVPSELGMDQDVGGTPRPRHTCPVCRVLCAPH